MFRYVGHPEAEHVFVQMGSGTRVTESVLEHVMGTRSAKVGVLSPYLYRPWAPDHFLEKLPKTTKTITVLDRTKEHGAYREPLFLDVAASVQQDNHFGEVKLFGGRYGLGSKEYTPSMAISVIDNALRESPQDPFTVGIEDDITFLSLPNVHEETFQPEGETSHCVFFGLSGDGTVGANKNAVKIIGDNSNLNAQAFFNYSSVKAGAVTTSHLRFGLDKIEMPYLIQPDLAKYVACSMPNFVNSIDLVQYSKPEGVFVLNCTWDTVD